MDMEWDAAPKADDAVGAAAAALLAAGTLEPVDADEPAGPDAADEEVDPLGAAVVEVCVAGKRKDKFSLRPTLEPVSTWIREETYSSRGCSSQFAI